MRILVFIFSFLVMMASVSAEESGKEVYEIACANCHENEALRAPNLSSLMLVGREGLISSLKTGSMRDIGKTLEDEEFASLIDFLTSTNNKSVQYAHERYCDYSISENSSPLWSGWGNGLNNTRNQSSSRISKSNVNQLKLNWAFGFKDSVRVRSQPLVTEDALFIGSQSGDLYALSLRDGCIFWSYKAKNEIRGAIILSEDKKSIFFSDFAANIYRLNIITGDQEWIKNISDHQATTITGSMTTAEKLLFVPLSSTEIINAIDPEYSCCSFRGGVAALDTQTGNMVWRMHTVPEAEKTIRNSVGTQMLGPSGAPVWSTPTIDLKRGLLYVGVGQNYSHPATDMSDAVVALRISDGEVVWHKQMLKGDVWNASCVTNKINCPGNVGPDMDIGASILLTSSRDNKELLMVGQKSGMVYALNPNKAGEIVWQRRVGRGGKKGGVHWGMTADSDNLYVPVADIPEDLDTSNEAMPGLHALALSDGQYQWYKSSKPVCEEKKFKCYSSYSAAVSSTNDMVIAGSMNGNIEMFSSNDGSEIWSYETAKPFETINNISANGGSIDSDGPVVAGEHLITTSGYDIYGQITGNVLLVFTLEE